MKKLNLKFYFIGCIIFFYSCTENETQKINITTQNQQFKIINVTNHDGKPFSTGIQKTSLTGSTLIIPEEAS